MIDPAVGRPSQHQDSERGKGQSQALPSRSTSHPVQCQGGAKNPILVLPDGHRLENSLDRVVSEFREFLQTCLSDMNRP